MGCSVFLLYECCDYSAESLESHTERLRKLCQTLRDSNINAMQDRMPYSPNICDASYAKKRTTGT